MPQLPTSNLQSTVSTRSSGNRIDPNTFAQAGRDLTAAGSGILSLSEQLGKVQDTWTKAAVTNQYTTARNDRKAAINDILSRAKSEPDHSKGQGYYEELEKYIGEDREIDDEGVKQIYDSESQLDKDLAWTSLNEVFRGKMVRHQQGEMLKDSNGSRDAYIGATGEAERGTIKQLYLDRLKNNKDAGFVDEKIYQSELEEVKDWEYDRAMKMVGDNPRAALEDLDSFGIEDKNKLNNIVNMAKANISRQAKIDEIATLEVQNTNQSVLMDMLLADPTTNMSEKIVMIDKQEMMGDISTTFATKARRFMKSSEVIGQDANHADMAETIRMVYDANMAYENDFNEVKYLTKIKGIQERIISVNGLTSQDRLALQKKLDLITQKKTSEAAVDLGGVGGPETKIYRDANKFFETALPAYMRDEALRNFFYKSADKEMSATESKVLMQNVSLEIQFGKRKVVQDAFDLARETEGAGADLRLERHKSGVFAVNLYKNGKRVKVVQTLGSK